MAKTEAERYAALMLGDDEEYASDEDKRLFCLVLAAENRDEQECWVEMARRAYRFLTGANDTEITDDTGTVIGLFRPE